VAYPGYWASVTPDKPAIIMAASGRTVTHAQLDERSRRLAAHLHSAGLRPGDHIALLAENNIRYHEIVWAALRSGLIITAVNRHLTAEEAAYIIDDCDARVLITSTHLADVALEIGQRIPRCELRLSLDGPVPGFDDYEAYVAPDPPGSAPDGPRGDVMLYSSGTTGRPKGIRRAPPGGMISDGLPSAARLRRIFDFGEQTIYLSPAPLYHSGPLGFTLAVHGLGGTTVIMEHFDPIAALEAIERYKVNTSQWVPTMFSRMLRLPETSRTRFDLSSHRMAIHAAAPCPRPMKEAMLEWWGPIIHEYYGGTEGSGLTHCTPQEWRDRPESVGRAVSGELHICDENGVDLPPGEIGTVYFEQPTTPFSYHKDPERTVAAQHPEHPSWTTMNDIGRLDRDGFLYLTDRAAFVIISGGVNIYPREIEECLLTHEKVEDVAVFGIPDADLGEQVMAVVQPRERPVSEPALERELITYARERLSHFKCPRSIAFEPELPRLPTGKLHKGALRDRYRRAPCPHDTGRSRPTSDYDPDRHGSHNG
jgi:fatty-acyl-CoA synthase